MKLRRVVSLSLAACVLSGCASVPRRDATAGLIARPDFASAATAAPEWVRAALREVTALEAELQRAPSAKQ